MLSDDEQTDDKQNICGRFSPPDLDAISDKLRQLRFSERGIDNIPRIDNIPWFAHPGRVVAFVRHVFDLMEFPLANPFKQLHLVLYHSRGGRKGYDVAVHYEADELFDPMGHIIDFATHGAASYVDQTKPLRDMIKHNRMLGPIHDQLKHTLKHKTRAYIIGTKYFTDMIKHACGFHLSPRGHWLLRQWDLKYAALAGQRANRR